MQQIPIMIPPMEDELLVSWVARLARANCLDLSLFYKAYIRPNCTGKEVGIRQDFREKFEFFWRALPYELDELELFFATTTFTADAPFMTREQRQRYINHAFNPNNRFEDLFPLPHGTIQKLHYCRACAVEEQTQFGFAWVHRAHNLPGVQACCKHGRPLICVPRKWDYDFTSLLNTEPQGRQAEPVQVEYAVFCKEFLEARLDCSIEDLAPVIYRKINEIYGDSGGLEMARKEFSLSRFSDIVSDGNVKYLLQQSLRDRNYVSAVSCLTMLLFLFRSAKAIKHLVEENQQKAEDPRFYLPEDYSMIGPFRRDLVKLKHRCGNTFCTSPFGFEHGWRCPVCDKASSVTEKCSELVSLIDAGQYELISPFTSMNEPITVRHSCGKERTLRARAFLYEGSRCNCSWRVDYKKAKNAVEENEGFELIEYTRTDRPVIIRHSCGGEFSISYSKFLEHPRCRVCQRQGHLYVRTTQDLVRDIADLTGDEYTLMSPYKSPKQKVSIRHNLCGNTQEYYPYYFLSGARCRTCTKDSNDEQFDAFVEQISFGRYRIIGKDSNYLYQIKDTETGNVSSVPKLITIQELKRPTPSIILPLENRIDIDLREDRPSEQLLKMLLHNYSAKEPIFTEDICFDGMSREMMQTVISNLGKSGKLKHISLGVYALPDANLTADEIIVARYIVRKGKRIGFLRGQSFAYEIGLCEKPAEWHIATNKESVKTPNRKTTFLGEPIHIKGMPAEINETNYIHFSVIDFLIQYRQCVSCSEDDVIHAVRGYIKANNHGSLFPYEEYEPTIENYKTANIRTMMRRLIRRVCDEE